MRSPACWAVVALVLVLTGCGGNATASGTAAERLVPLTPAIRTAYDGYWSAWLAANRDADPDLPGLAAHAADPHLEVLRAELTPERRGGHVVRGESRTRCVACTTTAPGTAWWTAST